MMIDTPTIRVYTGHAADCVLAAARLWVRPGGLGAASTTHAPGACLIMTDSPIATELEGAGQGGREAEGGRYGTRAGEGGETDC